MKEEEVLAATAHRHYPVPKEKWKSYQEWHDVVMLHWCVPAAHIQELLPPGVALDTFEGEAWISWVGFTVKKMRLRNLPPLPYLSCFEEVNLRTYVVRDGRPGIFLLSVEADKLLDVWLNRIVTGIPYVRSRIDRKEGQIYVTNRQHSFESHINYSPLEPFAEKTALDIWLTERHCLYVNEGEKLYRYDIHHKEWKLSKLVACATPLRYKIGAVRLPRKHPGLKHFSKKVRVLLWGRKLVNSGPDNHAT